MTPEQRKALGDELNEYWREKMLKAGYVPKSIWVKRKEDE